MKILVSNNYKKFKLSEVNRDIGSFNFLEFMMKKYGFLPGWPIVVVRNGNKDEFTIIDGHTRFYVAQKLGLAFYYVELPADNCPTMREIEASKKPWKLKDYLSSYVKCGKAPYIFVKEYADAFGIQLQAAISMLAGVTAGATHYDNDFRDGVWTLGDPEHARLVGSIVKTIEETGFMPSVPTNFVRAISRTIRAKGFDAEKMKEKIKRHFTLLKKQPTLDLYMDMLDEIYNRGAHDRIPLKFNAEQAMRERQGFKKGHK